MITEAQIRELLKQQEGPTLEFKVNTPMPEQLARLLSSFSNTQGGTVLVGVREAPNEIVGTDIDRFNTLVRRALERLHGGADVRHHHISVNGKNVGVIEVSRSQGLVASDTGYFQRVGEQDQPLSAQELASRVSTQPDRNAALASLTETITAQTGELTKLRESFDNANSWKRKLLWAAIGAATSAAAKGALAYFGLG
jgi:predicted HTH transcriptional regulator